MNVDRSTVRYQIRRDDNKERRETIRRISKKRRRFTLAETQETLEAWQDDYNTRRPHSALDSVRGNLTPMGFAEKKCMEKLAA